MPFTLDQQRYKGFNTGALLGNERARFAMNRRPSAEAPQGVIGLYPADGVDVTPGRAIWTGGGVLDIVNTNKSGDRLFPTLQVIGRSFVLVWEISRDAYGKAFLRRLRSTAITS